MHLRTQQPGQGDASTLLVPRASPLPNSRRATVLTKRAKSRASDPANPWPSPQSLDSNSPIPATQERVSSPVTDGRLRLSREVLGSASGGQRSVQAPAPSLPGCVTWGRPLHLGSCFPICLTPISHSREHQQCASGSGHTNLILISNPREATLSPYRYRNQGPSGHGEGGPGSQGLSQAVSTSTHPGTLAASFSS